MRYCLFYVCLCLNCGHLLYKFLFLNVENIQNTMLVHLQSLRFCSDQFCNCFVQVKTDEGDGETDFIIEAGAGSLFSDDSDDDDNDHDSNNTEDDDLLPLDDDLLNLGD